LKLLGKGGKYKFLLIFGKLAVNFSAYKTWAWLSEPLYINWQSSSSSSSSSSSGSGGSNNNNITAET
jgi:hypothetical protein